MGYQTIFNGEIEIVPPLNESERSFLEDFNQTRRMIRTKGPLFVGGSGWKGQGGDDDVLDHNRASGEKPYGRAFPTDATEEELKHYEEGGQPGLWCQWTPAEDGASLAWDEGEKFYNASEWMRYIVTNLLSGESARAYVSQHLHEDERLKDFTFDHVLNGEIDADGEESDDFWRLVVTDSRVEVVDGKVLFEAPKDPLNQHIEKVCEEAGLTVMEQVYDILLNREGEGMEEALAKLTAEDVTSDYFGYLGPAIDNIERNIEQDRA